MGAGNGTPVFCESRAHSKLVGPKIVLIFEFRHTVNSTDGLALDVCMRGTSGLYRAHPSQPARATPAWSEL